MGNELIRHDWNKEDYKEYRRRICRESQRRRRTMAVAYGLCSICASYPAREGMLTCENCNDCAKAWNKKRGKQNENR